MTVQSEQVAHKTLVDGTEISLHTHAGGGGSPLTVSGATAYSGASPTSWTDLNLSSIVGENSAMVILQISATSDMNATAIRKNGDGAEYYSASNEASAYGIALGHHDSTCDMVLICVTDTSGVIEWKTESSSTATIKVIAYIK